MTLLSPYHSAQESLRAPRTVLFSCVFLQTAVCLLTPRLPKCPQVIFCKSCVCMSSTQGSLQSHHESICQSLFFFFFFFRLWNYILGKQRTHSLLLYEICRRWLQVTMLFCISADAEKQNLSWLVSLRRCATLITVYEGAVPTHNITS